MGVFSFTTTAFGRGLEGVNNQELNRFDKATYHLAPASTEQEHLPFEQLVYQAGFFLEGTAPAFYTPCYT